MYASFTLPGITARSLIAFLVVLGLKAKTCDVYDKD
jgi:hypothetical protein